MHLTQTLHAAVQRAPDRPITVFANRTRTARECRERVSRVAGGLRDLGLERGETVAVLSCNSDRYHELLLAIAWADLVVVPLNIRWTAAEIAFALDDSNAGLLLFDEVCAALVPAVREQYDGLRATVFLGNAGAEDASTYERLVRESEAIPDARRGGDELFGIFYTGGTTGRPKGVMLSHDNILISAMGSLASGSFLTPGGRLLHAAPMFHLGDVAAWTAGLLVGSTHVIIPAFTPAATLEAIAQHSVTEALLVPVMIQMLLASSDLEACDVLSVQHILYAGSAISASVLTAARAAFPRAGFTQSYGMTELGPVATLLSPSDHDDPQLLQSAGRAAPHAELTVVDEDDAEVPPGTIGEIVVRGDNVMRGYLNAPDETGLALRGGWMHTGDLGRMNDQGYLFVVDRLKDMILSGGENVYSAEVENSLAMHPAVEQCAVVGLPDPQWGERVHAVVVVRAGHAVGEEDLTSLCRTHIAGYKIPRSFQFVEALPVSSAGKVLKRELRTSILSSVD